jgi:heme O synthase-like polyprenyltransferase
MDKQTLGNALLLILIGAAAVVAGLYYYNNYIEPQNDGPMERAGEKIDDALDGKK